MLDGHPVHRGQVLYHRNLRRTGGVVTAAAKAEDCYVVVRTSQGAESTVLVHELRWTMHPHDVEHVEFIRMAHEKLGIRAENIDIQDFRFWQMGRASAAQDAADADRYRKLRKAINHLGRLPTTLQELIRVAAGSSADGIDAAVDEMRDYRKDAKPGGPF